MCITVNTIPIICNFKEGLFIDLLFDFFIDAFSASHLNFMTHISWHFWSLCVSPICVTKIKEKCFYDLLQNKLTNVMLTNNVFLTYFSHYVTARIKLQTHIIFYLGIIWTHNLIKDFTNVVKKINWKSCKQKQKKKKLCMRSCNFCLQIYFFSHRSYLYQYKSRECRHQIDETCRQRKFVFIKRFLDNKEKYFSFHFNYIIFLNYFRNYIQFKKCID